MSKTAKQFVRNDGRTCTQVRPLSLAYDQFGYAASSALLAIGETRVLVAVSLQDTVPPFLRNSGTGWLTAEYAMLPTATRTRTPRDSESGKKQGRSVEIARLIGRSLRSVVDYKSIGEKTIVIDCDVLQADGGTRAACITAASYALQRALRLWHAKGLVPLSVTMRPIAALSAGVVGDQLMIDLTQKEDNAAAADVTFVLTAEGDVVEIQGAGEKYPLPWSKLVTLQEMTSAAIKELFAL